MGLLSVPFAFIYVYVLINAPINVSSDYPPTWGRVGIWRGLAIHSYQCPCTGAHLSSYYWCIIVLFLTSLSLKMSYAPHLE